MISHEEASLYLAELRQGRLEAGRSDAVREHLAGCEECRALSETYELLADTLAAEAPGAAAHPRSDEIVAYAQADARIGTSDLARIGSHVRSCSACSREVEASRGAIAASSRTVRPARPARWPAPLALAAGFAALVMIYPAYLGLRRAPAARSGEPWPGGAAGSLYLDVLRSGEGRLSAPEVTLQAGRPYTVILLEPTLPEGTEDAAPFRVLISSPDGSVVWEGDLTAGEIRRHMESSSRSVTLLVSSGALRPGRHTLALKAAGHDGQPPLLEAPFVVKE